MFLKSVVRMNFGRHLVADANKLLGKMGSYSTLQNLINSDVASLAISMRKLLVTNHPLPTTIRHFFSNDHELFQTFSAIILLISHACQPYDKGSSARVTESQRSLAEISEIIYAAHFIHMSVLNFFPDNNESQEQLLMAGNKMAVLGGDYLLANASIALAKIGKPSVIAAVSSAISDMSLAALNLNARREDNVRCWRYNDLSKWQEQATLRIASLLSHCCSATADLVDADDKVQDICKCFAKHAAMLITLHWSCKCNKSTTSESQVSVPILMADDEEIVKLKKKHSDNALEALHCLPQSESSESLKKFATSMRA